MNPKLSLECNARAGDLDSLPVEVWCMMHCNMACDPLQTILNPADWCPFQCPSVVKYVPFPIKAKSQPKNLYISPVVQEISPD